MQGRFDALLAEFFDGAIDTAGAAELVRMLEADPERAALFVDIYRQSRALEPILGADDPGFTRAVLDAIQRDERPFVRDVMAAVLKRPPQRTRPWVAVAALAAAAALVLVVGTLAVRPAAVARVLASGPHVTVVRAGRTLAAPAGFALRADDTLTTPAGERASVEYLGERTRLELEPRTELGFRQTAHGKRLDLVRGEVQADVDHQPAGRPMVLHGVHARAEVLGTRLKLSAVPDATRLEVQDGRVRLVRRRDGATVDVMARHFSVADDDAALVSEPTPPPSSLPPAVTGFSLMAVDGPGHLPLPGFERLGARAAIDVGQLAGRRFNLRAHTTPERVGSVRFTIDNDDGFNTEISAPYTLVSAGGRRQRAWTPTPGRYTITATPYTGSYGNGIAGTPLTITVEISGSAR